MIDGGRDASVCHMSLRNVAACVGDLDEIFPALDWLHYTLKASEQNIFTLNRLKPVNYIIELVPVSMSTLNCPVDGATFYEKRYQIVLCWEKGCVRPREDY